MEEDIGWRNVSTFGEMLSSFAEIFSFSGGAALSSDQSTLIIDNLTGRRFDVHAIPSASLIASLNFSSSSPYTKQCIFSEGAKIAVCGSTVNKIHLVDVTTNEIVQALTARNGESSES